MQGVIPYPYYQKLKKIRRNIYLAVIIFGLINIFFPLVAHADLFGFYVPDVYDEITENVKETNGILAKAFSFAQVSPYNVVNSMPGSTAGIATSVRNATKTMALVTATLLLMVEFFRKTTTFEWSSKWENILIFLVKVIVIKQVIQNADVLVGYVYSMFNSINNAATGGSTSYLPDGDQVSYSVLIKQSFVKQLKKGWWDYWYDKGAGDVYDNYTYNISKEAVKMFFPSASFPANTTMTDTDQFIEAFANPTTKMNFFPTWELIKLQPFFLVMKAIAYLIFVIVIGRVFELSVYTIFAPLPLATFASDTTHEIAKNFLKNYIATVLQIAVIVIMFIVYTATNNYVVNYFASGSTRLLNIIILCALGLGVMKSGAWSKKVCGIG